MEINENIAEILGIIVGDGYIGHYPYQNKYLIEIAGDSRYDKEYLLDYVTYLFQKNFGIEPKRIFRKKQKTMYLRICSKKLALYFNKLGIPFGKKGQLLF